MCVCVQKSPPIASCGWETIWVQYSQNVELFVVCCQSNLWKSRKPPMLIDLLEKSIICKRKPAQCSNLCVLMLPKFYLDHIKSTHWFTPWRSGCGWMWLAYVGALSPRNNKLAESAKFTGPGRFNKSQVGINTLLKRKLWIAVKWIIFTIYICIIYTYSIPCKFKIC